MKIHQTSLLLLTLAVALTSASMIHAAQVSTSFTFQGQLKQNGVPVNGPHDISVTVHPTASSPQGLAQQVFNCEPVNNGLVSLKLSFGGLNASIFTNCEGRWLEFAVRPCNSTTSFQVLTQRVELLPTPYALNSLQACAVASDGVTTLSIQDNAITASKIGSNQVVKSLNGLRDAVNLVAGNNVTLTPSGNNIQISAVGGPGIWNLNGTSAYYNAGNVGIGTDSPSPSSQLHSVATAGHGVQGNSADRNASGVYGANSGQGYGVTGRTTGTGIAVWGDNSDPNGLAGLFSGRLQVGGNIAAFGNLSFGAATRQMLNLWSTGYGIGVQAGTLYHRSDFGFAWFRGGIHDDAELAPGANGKELMRLSSEGGLHVRGNYAELSMQNRETQDFVAIPTAGERWVWYASQGICRLWSGGEKISVDTAGTLSVSGSASVCSLTIRGGCDLAEPFQISGSEIPKGSLVIIDEENAGKLKMAGQEYDTRVAGIVSGANGLNPGISLHQEGLIEGGQNVALSGRVYAWADAAHGPIKPGDLLTSSSTPGHVMKVTDHARAQGAIVGKAMSALKDGKGMVLVLVSLQ